MEYNLDLLLAISSDRKKVRNGYIYLPQNMNSISSEYNSFMDITKHSLFTYKYYILLNKIEGNIFHKLPTEKYITTPYGLNLGWNKDFKIPDLSLKELNNKFNTDINFRIDFRKKLVRVIEDKYMSDGVCGLLKTQERAIYFVFVYNVGNTTAKRQLQALLGVKVDGIIGKHTLTAIARYKGNLLNDMINHFTKYYQSLRNYNVYGKGWLNRFLVVKEVFNIK